MDFKSIISQELQNVNSKRVEIFEIGGIKVFDLVKYRISFIKLTQALYELKQEKTIHEYAYSNDSSKYPHNRPIIVFKN